jgi:hypothetical protein
MCIGKSAKLGLRIPNASRFFQQKPLYPINNTGLSVFIAKI